MKKVFTTLSLALLAMVACDKAEMTTDSQEKGSVAISCGVATEVEMTRAELTTQVQCTCPTTDEFALEIDGATSEYHAEYASVAEFQNGYLYRGDYIATVEAGDVANEGYNCVAFVGQKQFSVEPRKHIDVQITATIANALVMVEVTDAFKSYFAGGYELILTTEQGNTFDVTSQSDYLYIAPTSFTIAATGTKQPNESGAEGAVVALPEFKREELAARTIYTVKYDVSEAGEATLTISLGGIVEEYTFDNELNQYA